MNDIFSVKSIYGLIYKCEFGHENIWHFIWKIKVPPKLNTFLWLISIGKLLSNEQWARRGLTSDSSCNSCSIPVESIIHILGTVRWPNVFGISLVCLIKFKTHLT